MSEVATYTTVGSGTLLPSPSRGSAAHHLATPEGSILLDCGTGSLHGLARAGLDWRALDVIALSHFHTDHVSDLPALLSAYRVDGRTRPLTITGPLGVERLLGGLSALFGAWLREPAYDLAVCPLTGTTQEVLPGVEFSTMRTPHTDTSIAYRVAGAWGSLGYTGDTGPCEELGVFFDGVDLLVAECGAADGEESANHLSPSKLVDLLRAAAPGAAVLTHVYPPQEPDEVANFVAARCGVSVSAAFDGFTTRIEPGPRP